MVAMEEDSEYYCYFTIFLQFREQKVRVCFFSLFLFPFLLSMLLASANCQLQTFPPLCLATLFFRPFYSQM